MSGGGGSTPDRGGGDDRLDCASLVVDTTINSPDRAVIKKLKKGATLGVELGQTPQGREILLAKTRAGEIAGSLTPPRILDIMQCLKDGHTYVAEVLADPVGGECRVRIRSGHP